MSKALTATVELVGAVGMGVAAAFDPALIASPWFDKILAGLVMSGIGNAIGAVGDALVQNRGMQISTRQPASPRTIVYGTQMVGGVVIYESFTGHQWNQVIVLAGHRTKGPQQIFLDGRQVFFANGGFGDADHNDHLGPDGITKYNFGGKVSVFFRNGTQQAGDYMHELQGNDPTWGPNANADVPSLMGCTYIYLKLTQSDSQFPSRPEVKVVLDGKDDIYDPRTNSRSFTNNAALVLADVIGDPEFGLGDSNINLAQLIAAANLCDEQVAVAALNGQTESRYCCDWAYDTTTPVADVMQTMLTGMAGRYSFTGGEHFIFPGAYTGPSASLDVSDITAAFDWNPNRSVRDLPNRVTATHVSPQYPYSVSGNYYRVVGGVQNNFDLKFTNTSVPDYAVDPAHGYPSDEYLTEDGGHQRPLSMNFPTVLSMTQCQRLMKINLLRARKYQGNGTLELRLGNYKLQTCDALQFTFSLMNWQNRVMEVGGTSLRIANGDDSSGPTVRYSMSLKETGSDIYSWSTLEELTILAAPAAPTQTPYVPNPPTNMHLFSGPNTAIVAEDGSVVAVIEVTFDTPLDNVATGIVVQYRRLGSSNWYNAPTVDISLNIGLIAGIIAGQNYDVRIATVRASGAISDWVEQDGFPVPSLDTFLGTLSSQLPSVNGWVGKWWRLPANGAPPASGGDLPGGTLFGTTGSNANLILAVSGGASYSFAGATYVPAPSDGGDLQNIYARFTTSYVASTTGTYTFGVNSDDGCNVRVGGVQLVSALATGHPAGSDRTYTESGTINLTAGTMYQIVVEYHNGPGSGALQILFTPPGASSPQLLDLGASYRQAGSVQYSDGTPVQSLQPAQSGADKTSQNTSNDTSFVSGVPANIIATVVPSGFKLVIDDGAKKYSIQALNQ